MIAGKRYVGPGCDMWSCGVILFALLCGYLPFEDANTARLYEKIMGGEYDLPDFLSSDAKDLITKLLTTDPRKRFNAEQVRRHPWYARISVSTDPFLTTAEMEAPIVPGPQSSGRKVRKTIGGTVVDDEDRAVDAEVLRHMTMLGYHPQQVQESIASNRHDHFAATYHLLMIKKGMTQPKPQTPQHQQQQTPSQPSSSAPKPPSSSPRPPPSIPRIPITSAGPQVPSAPLQPKQGGYARPTPAQGIAAPQNATMPVQPIAQQPPAHSPVPPSSARVQSAGVVRPAVSAVPYPATARPTTSYQSTPKPADPITAYPARPTTGYQKPTVAEQSPQRPGTGYQQKEAAQAWGQEPAQVQQPMGLGVANGVNGGAGVNAYMQFQAQAAALYASTPGALSQTK
jgi:serine/threonine protein kinase